MVRRTKDKWLESLDKDLVPPVRFTSTGQRLGKDEREIIERLVWADQRYIDHPSFASFGEDGPQGLSQEGLAAEHGVWPVSGPLGGSLAPFSHLLSKGEEMDLFLRMNYARYRLSQEVQQARKRRVPISRGKKILQWHRVRTDVRAQLVQSNLPLVLSMAKKMRIQGVDFGDIVCEGNMALLRAVDAFDCSRGFKFSTYACRAILKSFARMASKSNKYRLRFPTEFDPAYEKSDWQDTQRVEAAQYCTELLLKILKSNSACLSEVELEVIKGRFAFSQDQTRKTLVEMGRVLGLTKERVRQIQKKAVAKLREVLEEKLMGI